VGIALNDGAVSTPTGNPLSGGPYNATRPFDNVAPSVSLAITSPSAGTYTTGQVITVTATFSESVTGTAILPFSVNGVATSAQTCTGTGTTRTCSYTIQSTDSGAITIAASTLTGSLTDAAGNTATLTHAAVNTPVITADTVPLTVSIPDLITADDTGSNTTDDLTNKATVTLNGTAKAGSTVTLYTGSTCASGSEVGTPQTATGGTYSFASVALSAGANTYSAKATDGVNTPVCSASGLTVTRDSIAPSVTLGSLTSPSATTTQTLSATATDAVGVTEVTFYVDSTSYTGTFNTGTWSSAPIMGFTSGAYAITAQAKDAAGNTTTSSSFSLTIDTTAPAAPTAPDLAAASDSGVNTDNTTNITPVTFTGTAEAGSTVSLYAQTACGGSVVATTTGGSYTFTGVALTANATTTFSAKATDAAGNASPCSSNLAVTHDTIAPTVAFTATAGSYASGQTLGLTATYSEPVSISAGGNPSVPLTLTTGTLTATDTGGAATNVTTRTFTTGTIGASGTHQDIDSTLNVGTVALNSATITDAAGNALTLTPTPATVTGVTINVPIVATGGTTSEITVGGINYKVHTFTSNGTFTVTGGTLSNVEYLIVGGGGGSGQSPAGGGGGGGGQVVNNSISLNAGNYSVTVGEGGAVWNDGSNSVFGSITAIGGKKGQEGTGDRAGAGGATSKIINGVTNAYTGGSATNTSNTRRAGGGGAGSGQNGTNAAASIGGNGGNGFMSNITGADSYYGGGGGGGAEWAPANSGVIRGIGGLGGGGNGEANIAGRIGYAASTAGTPNTGGGGGGTGGLNGVGLGVHRAGGSGIVIIRYPI
jgi:hypothetical protein